MTRLTILCVDDQREVLAALRKDLTLFEEICDLIECESAAEAEGLVEKIAAGQGLLFLIICDHIMPGENGIDFIARLDSEGRLGHTKKVLLTGLADQTDTIRAINEAHIDHYLEKPWESEGINRTVRKLLTAFIKEEGLDPEDYAGMLA